MSSVNKDKQSKSLWKKKKAKDEYKNLIIGMSKRDFSIFGSKKPSLKHMGTEESIYKNEKGFKIKRSPSITQRSMADSETTKTALIIPNLGLKEAFFFNSKEAAKADENSSHKTDRSLRNNFLLKSSQIVQFNNNRRESETQYSGFLTDRKQRSPAQKKSELALTFRLQKSFSKGKMDRSANKAARSPQLLIKLPKFKFTRKQRFVRNDLYDTNEAFEKKILALKQTSQEARIKELVSFNRFLNTRALGYGDSMHSKNKPASEQLFLHAKLVGKPQQSIDMERDEEEEERGEEASSSKASDEEPFYEYDFKRSYESEATVPWAVFSDLFQAINGTLHYALLTPLAIPLPLSRLHVNPSLLLISPYKGRLVTARPGYKQGFLSGEEDVGRVTHGVTLLYSNDKKIVYSEDEVENDIGQDSVELWGFDLRKMLRKQFEFEKLNLLLFAPVMRIMNSTHTKKLMGDFRDIDSTKEKNELSPRKSNQHSCSGKSERSTKKAKMMIEMLSNQTDLFNLLRTTSETFSALAGPNYLYTIRKIRMNNPVITESEFERTLLEPFHSPRRMPDITVVHKAMSIAFPMILINKIGKDGSPTEGGLKECNTPRKRLVSIGGPRKESLISKCIVNSPSWEVAFPETKNRSV